MKLHSRLHPTYLLRLSWVRMIVVAVVLTSLVWALTAGIISADLARQAAVGALQGSVVLFTVATAVAVFLFSNYVRGLKDAYTVHANGLRDRLCNFLDLESDTKDPDIRKIIDVLVIPLLSLGSRKWDGFDAVHEVRNAGEDEFNAAAQRIHERKPDYLPRHLLRIEDDLNELGIIFIRRAVSVTHSKLVSGVFLLIAWAIVVFSSSQFIGQTQVADTIVACLCVSTVVLGVLELLLLRSWLVQEAREEEPAGNANKDEGDEPDSANGGAI